MASTLAPAPPSAPPRPSLRHRALTRVFDAVALAGATLAREAPTRPLRSLRSLRSRRRRFSR